MAKIKKLTFIQACAKTGRDPKKVLRYAKPANSEQEGENAIKMLEVLCEAYNMVMGKKWIPDYSKNEAKWYPWFRFDAAARVFRFDFATYVYSDADAGSGSRHVSRTRDIAVFLGTEHEDLWNKWLVK